MYNLFQKLVAEFLGTFALIFFGAGAICVDFHLRSTGGIGLLAVALAHGLAIAIMVSALGHISGGHFNPAITIGFWVTRRLSTLDSLAYWGAQLLGAAAAAFLLKLVMPEEVVTNTFLGTPELMRDFPRWSGMALEAVTTYDNFGHPGRRPVHRRCAQSCARIRPRSGFRTLVELGHLLGRPPRRRLHRRPAVRFPVSAQAWGMSGSGSMPRFRVCLSRRLGN